MTENTQTSEQMEGDPLVKEDNADAPPKRPTLVYVALAAGAAVLLILLLIVWLSSRNGQQIEPALCLDIEIDEVGDVIRRGEVEQIDVLVAAALPTEGLTAIQLQMEDDDCRRLPEGAASRDILYQTLGMVTLYNENGERPIQINYILRTVPVGLLHTSTPTPTETAVPSPTVTPDDDEIEATPFATSTQTPTSMPTPIAMATRTATAVVTQEAASPVASPVASPLAATATATLTPEGTP
ncbi:hypothetical protein BH23CHL5_BH23CHL5_04690 [soil metagenome]